MQNPSQPSDLKKIRDSVVVQCPGLTAIVLIKLISSSQFSTCWILLAHDKSSFSANLCFFRITAGSVQLISHKCILSLCLSPIINFSMGGIF